MASGAPQCSFRRNERNRPGVMHRRDDAFAFFPVAIAGAVIGLGMMIGGGHFAYDYRTAGNEAHGLSSHAIIEGRVAWAGWRTSAAGGGPDRFLQFRLENDPRGFLVAADDLSSADRKRFKRSHSNDDEVPTLTGATVVVAVDSALLDEETPYIAGLRVGGTTIIPARRDPSDSMHGWTPPALLTLYWICALVGVGILGASVQHIIVCVRYWRSGDG